jgi:Ca2+-binding EF-hand superfamily protein
MLLSLATQGVALGQFPKNAESPRPLLDLFLELDANNDRVIERSEVPESGLAAFDRLLKHGDRNHDGKLEAEEYRDLLQKVNWSAVGTPEQRERRFKNLDHNQDGKLDRQEFPGGPARFAQLDRNHDGFLSRDEIPWLNPGATGPLAKPKGTDSGGEEPFLKRLARMDKNGDGRISRDEFTGQPAMFDRLDVNHDGYLDKSDRRQGPARSAQKAEVPKPAKASD